MRHEQRFTVSYEYPVYFVTGLFSPENSALVDAITRREPVRRHRVAVVVEKRVSALWPTLVASIEAYCAAHAERLSLVAPPEIVLGGEECKNDPEAPGRLASFFDRLGMDRQSHVVVVGGGGLQDMVGYAAAITHRGIRTVRVPTTVLSQNDSGVGVKNGVNAFGKKNFLGTFAPPFAVLADPSFLDTLEPRDKAAGMSEAVKVALIKDRGFFEWLEAHAERLRAFERDLVSELVRRCAVLHLDHIAGGGDPFELGSSRPLDFGHWAAHKLESLSNYSLRHGEAVAVGIVLDTRYSVEMGLLPGAHADRVIGLIERLGLPTWDPRLDVRDAGGRRHVLDGIREFREHLGGDLTVMMLRDLGHGHEVRTLDEAVIDRVVDWLGARARTAQGGSRARASGAGELGAARG